MCLYFEILRKWNGIGRMLPISVSKMQLMKKVKLGKLFNIRTLGSSG